jgi:hypothetical protein
MGQRVHVVALALDQRRAAPDVMNALGQHPRVRHQTPLFAAFSSVRPIKSMTWSGCTEIV